MNINDWQKMDFHQLELKYNLNREKLYQIVLSKKLYNFKSVNERYSMSKLDDYYLRQAVGLSVRQLSNMFHKSYNAMLIYVKTKGYYNRIR